MIIDFHVHLGEATYPKYNASLDHLLNEMDVSDVDRAVVFPQFNIVPGDYGVQNRWISRIASEHEDRLVGFARLNPLSTNVRREAERALGKFGLRGVKLHMYDEGFTWSSPGLEEAMSVIDDHRVPLLIHVTDAVGLAGLCERYPSVPIVYAHAGYYDIKHNLMPTDAMISDLIPTNIMSIVRKHSNLYLEPSHTIFPRVLRRVVKEAADRVVFGSNFPLGDMRFAIHYFELSHLSEIEMQKVMYGNALKLLEGET